MSDIQFMYVFDGGNVEEVFSVRLPLDELVVDMKEEIKERNENSLRDVDARNLAIWKVSDPRHIHVFTHLWRHISSSRTPLERTTSLRRLESKLTSE